MNPFTRGSLEYTCGLYAIVNSLRMATTPHKRLSNAQWFDLYFALTEAADERLGGTGSIIREGLTSTELKVLLQAANRWVHAATGHKVVWRKPYRAGQIPAKREYLRTLRRHLSAGGTAILSVSTGEEHWTCLYDMTERMFILCDSDGLTSLPISCFKAKWAPVDPSYTFLIGIV